MRWKLRIYPTRVGLIAVSGNVPTALTTIMQDASRTPACAIFGYGCLLDLDGATDVSDAARQFGFANPGVGRTFADLRWDVPLLIMRAGRDHETGELTPSAYDRPMKIVVREFVNVLLIVLGILSASMGLHGFLLSSNFIDGGVTGISMLLSKITPMPLSIWLPLVNLPFIALGYSQIGRRVRHPQRCSRLAASPSRSRPCTSRMSRPISC